MRKDGPEKSRGPTCEHTPSIHHDTRIKSDQNKEQYFPTQTEDGVAGPKEETGRRFTEGRPKMEGFAREVSNSIPGRCSSAIDAGIPSLVDLDLKDRGWPALYLPPFFFQCII